MRPRCFGLGRRSLRAGTAVRRLGRTRGRSLLSCVRMSMMPAELAWRTCSCPYSPEYVEGEFCELLRLLGILGSSSALTLCPAAHTSPDTGSMVPPLANWRG